MCSYIACIYMPHTHSLYLSHTLFVFPLWGGSMINVNDQCAVARLEAVANRAYNV